MNILQNAAWPAVDARGWEIVESLANERPETAAMTLISATLLFLKNIQDKQVAEAAAFFLEHKVNEFLAGQGKHLGPSP